LSDFELHNVRILEICEEVEIKDSIEFFGPQIELNLENSTELGKPPVEVTGVAPTAVVEVAEESSVEVLASVEKKMADQVDGTGAEPVLEAAETKLRGRAVGTGEPVRIEDRSGEEPDLMEVDQVVRTGGEPVHEDVAEETVG